MGQSNRQYWSVVSLRSVVDIGRWKLRFVLACFSSERVELSKTCCGTTCCIANGLVDADEVAADEMFAVFEACSRLLSLRTEKGTGFRPNFDLSDGASSPRSELHGVNIYISMVTYKYAAGRVLTIPCHK